MSANCGSLSSEPKHNAQNRTTPLAVTTTTEQPLMTNDIAFVRGRNRKPVASRLLEEALADIPGLQGKCFFGYPLIATPEGKFGVDATLVSEQKGIVLFDLIEGTEIGDYADRQDDVANKIEARLRLHKELVRRRELLVPLYVVTFCPAVTDIGPRSVSGYDLANSETLEEVIAALAWSDSDNDLYLSALSAIENISSIRKSRTKREVTREDSRGAKLKRLEDAIATLDHRQNRAVIETVDGVQRIRGLAGSGKTIVLALKAAYLHTQYPDWRIAVTFNTRSLKGQFKRLINNFCIEQTGEEPDWTRIRVVNAWGAPGGDDRDGIYFEFCRATNVPFLDFGTARNRFGGSERAFDGACQLALTTAEHIPSLYDCMLVDEAQDFSSTFLRLCYAIVSDPKRLVYAYDELQSLSGESLPSPEDIFGHDQRGRPLVSLADNSRQDVILEKCYRNSRPVLVSAHSLGFGIYRKAPPKKDTGLVQMFDHPRLWEEIGYRVKSGTLETGKEVHLQRTDETSPLFLEEHSPLTDLVQFIQFSNEAEQNEWLVSELQKNLEQDELRHDDIVVIHPHPLSARNKTGPIRKRLYELNIPSHLAGVDTSADVFFKTDTPSITFTGIYRAKGNEAGMVYIIDAQTCDSTGYDLATLRNRLFTAITRSKAWVRVLGHGLGMANLVREFKALEAQKFELVFTYPTAAMLEKLRVVHRDLSKADRERLEQRTKGLHELIRDLEAGTLHPEDIDAATREKLKQLFFEGEK